MMVKGAKALELWSRRVTEGYPGVDVSNMTTSWKDGLAFCAILHRYRPERIDFHMLDKRDIRGNNSLAFRVAEEAFGIPALLDPDDMAKCVAPDRLSILTQVSEYYHRLKNLQPRGNPLIRSVPETQSSPLPTNSSSTTTTQSTKLSRTSSTSSSGVASMASSCESSSSSVCDSPPPSASATSLARQDDVQDKVEQSKKDDKEIDEIIPEQKQKVEDNVLVVDEDSIKNSDSGNLVVLRRGGKSTESQRRALATRRRLVQSMIVESSSSMSSLCSPSPSPPSPAIEKENPFREAMMKFVAMEQEDGENKTKKKTKVFSTKSTETLVPTRDSKSTQTLQPSFVAAARSPAKTEDGVAFRTCLRTQLSCPAPASSGPTTNGAATGPSSRPRAPSTGPLSYTSTPRPYSSQSMTALNRSMTNIANNGMVGHHNNHNSSPISPPPLVHLRQEPQRALPTSAHRRPLSMLVPGQNDSPDYRHQRAGPTHPLPGTGYTPPMYQQQHSYTPQLSSPLWSPNSSLYLTPMGNGSPSSSGYASSVYSTPVGSSPCRNSRYTGTPLGQTSSNNSSPIRYRPASGGYHHHPSDRLQLHIEGQSSLV